MYILLSTKSIQKRTIPSKYTLHFLPTTDGVSNFFLPSQEGTFVSFFPQAIHYVRTPHTYYQVIFKFLCTV